MNIPLEDKKRTLFSNTLFFIGVLGIVLALFTQNIVLLVTIAAVPLVLLLLIGIINNTHLISIYVFVAGYLIIILPRYMNVEGVSYIMDGLFIFSIILALIDKQLRSYKNILIKSSNILVLGMLFWFIYCILELINSTAVVEGWMTSRGLALNGVLISFMAVVTIDSFKVIKKLIFVFAVLTLLAVLKSLVQKFAGWDPFEKIWLDNGGSTTHILITGIRYFSFFTDAGNFGSNMGAAGLMFSLLSFYEKQPLTRTFYFLVGILALYAMFLSGTRGAIIVPMAGLMFMSILSKKIKVFSILSIILIAVFMFFTLTYIGESNSTIRRMRTAFRYEEDASFNVRKENQELLGIYLKDKPFGVGVGLSGVENTHISDIYTTSIPNDSWYVKVWVETGIVGFLIYMSIWLGAISQAAWRLMFKVKNIEIRNFLSVYLSAIFGLLISAYGNPFWGQFPTNVIVYVGIVIALNGAYYESKISDTGEQDTSLSQIKINNV